MEQQSYDLIWTFGIIAVIAVGFHMTKNFVMDRFKATKVSTGKGAKEKQLDAQIDGLISNAPKMVQHIEEELSRLKETGANEEQMKSLKSKKSMLDFVVQNGEVINLIGKPIIKKAIGMIKAFG